MRRIAAFDAMLSVRIEGQDYRVSNETLDRLFGDDRWRRMDRTLLNISIRDYHRTGRLTVRRQRLRLTSPTEEAERRLRSEDSRDEILRWGMLYVASQCAEVANELRALRDALQFDTSAATATLSRDPAEDS
jgi:hypothetical protein